MTLRRARMTDELIDRVCQLDPVQAAIALQAALREGRAQARCLTCEAEYNVEGDITLLDHEPCPVCGGALELT